MTYKALLVEDDDAIEKAVRLRLRSLRHDIHRAACLEEAHALLAENRYSYIILDLGLPVAPGDPPDPLNGQNLLEEIVRSRGGDGHNAVIILTGQNDDIDLAVELLQRGAIDFVCKGVKPEKSEKTIDQVVKKWIGKRKILSAPDEPPELAPFPGGTLFIHPEGFGIRPDLPGTREIPVRFDSEPESTIRKILLLLLQRRTGELQGAFSEEFIAKEIGFRHNPQGPTRQRLSEFLGDCTKTLAEAGFAAERTDIIQNVTNHGYSYPDSMAVEVTGEPMEKANETLPVENTIAAANEPEDTDDRLDDMEQWILDRHRRGESLSWAAVRNTFDGGRSTYYRKRDGLKARSLIP